MWAFVSQFAVKWHTAESLKGFSFGKQNMIGQIAKIFKVQPVKAFTSKTVTSDLVCSKSKQLAFYPHASQSAWGFIPRPSTSLQMLKETLVMLIWRKEGRKEEKANTCMHFKVMERLSIAVNRRLLWDCFVSFCVSVFLIFISLLKGGVSNHITCTAPCSEFHINLDIFFLP